MPKLCICPVLLLALSPWWTPWTHAATLSPVLSLDLSPAAPDWSPRTWFVPLLCVVALIDPVISPGSVPCVQSLRDSVCGCRHGLCQHHLCSRLACTSGEANPLCSQQNGPLGDHCVVQNLPVSVSDLYCGDAMVHDAVVHEGLWLMALDSCLTGVCWNFWSQWEKGCFCPIFVSSLAAGVPDCDGAFEQRLANLVGFHHTCDSEPEKRLRNCRQEGKGRNTRTFWKKKWGKMF